MNPKHLVLNVILALAAIALMAYVVEIKEYWTAVGFIFLVIGIAISASVESGEEQAVILDAMDKLKADYRRQSKELEDLKGKIAAMERERNET